MPGVLFRHLSRTVLWRTVGVVLAFVALLELLELLERTATILNRHLGIRGVLTFAALRLPTMVQQVALIGVLVAAVLTFLQMQRANEIVALRAAGLSAYRLVALLLPAALGIGLFLVVLADQVLPRSERAFASWWQDTAGDGGEDTAAGSAIRLRLGPLLVFADRMRDGGRRLESVRIYERTPDGMAVTRRIEAQAAVFGEGHWTLVQASGTIVRDGVATQESPRDMVWAVTLKPATVVELGSEEVTLSLRDTLAVLEGSHASNRPPSFYRTELYRRLSAPFAVVLMILLGLPVIFAGPRGSYQSLLPVACIGAGLGYQVLNGMMCALGEAGTIPPYLAASTSLICFTCLILAAIGNLEES
jgi:lipopolysaccharide export system permease protein